MPAEGMHKRISFEEIVPEKTFDLNCHRSLGTIRQMDLPGECMRDSLGKRNKPDETKDLQEDEKRSLIHRMKYDVLILLLYL